MVDFSTEAQRLIKIISTGYTLLYKMGSVLLAKVEATGYNYFNQQVHRFQSRVKLMERTVGPINDPKSITRHADYPKYRPLSLCTLLQEEYGEHKRGNEWPALAPSIPEGNLSSSNNGHKCFKCNSETHLANNPICPEHPEHNSMGGGRGNSGNTP